jgi:hypothetical protein
MDDPAQDAAVRNDHKLMAMANKIIRTAYTSPADENARLEAVVPLFREFLGDTGILVSERTRLGKGAEVDMIAQFVLASLPDTMLAPLLLELKHEVGAGKGCPYQQASASLAHYVNANPRLFPACCMPTLLVYMAGHHIGVAAAVCMMDDGKPTSLIAPLTDMVSLLPTACGGCHTTRIARFIRALQVTVAALRGELTAAGEAAAIGPAPEPAAAVLHALPTVTDFVATAALAAHATPRDPSWGVDVADEAATLTYIRRITRGVYEATCELPGAPLRAALRVVVKFTRQYSPETQCVLAAKGLAPRLYYCGPVPGLGDWVMVVMDYVDGQPFHEAGARMAVARDNVRAALEMLHANDHVWGDARAPNLLVMADSSVRVVDFDWSGRAGEARWPGQRNQRVGWPVAVKDGDVITKQHDLDMLAMHFPQ